MDLGKYHLGDFFAESYPVRLLTPLPLTAQQNSKIKTASFMNKKLPAAHENFRIRAGTFKRVWGPGIDAKASIPPAYVAWRAGTITLFLLGA